MKSEDFAVLTSYVDDYGTYINNSYATGGAFNRLAHITESILNQARASNMLDSLGEKKFASRLSRAQWGILETALGKFKIYIATSDTFARDHRQDLTKATRQLVESFRAVSDRKIPRLSTMQGANTKRLRRLEAGKKIYPYNFKAFPIASEFFESENLEFPEELEEKAKDLEAKYWEIFRKVKEKSESK